MKNFLWMSIIIILILLNSIKSQDDEKIEYLVHFDMSDPDIIIIDKDNSNPEIKDIIADSRSIIIPKVKLDKEGYFFSGWTEDWVYGFEPGEVFCCITKNITLYPVFGLLSDKTTYTLEYIVEFEGEIIDTSEYISKGHYCKNRIVTTSLISFHQSTAVQRGWTDGKNDFVQEQKMVMPDHNVTLYAIFHYYRTLTYVPGDVDGVIGKTQDVQTMRAGGQKDLAEGTRLARMGYKMIGWHCENDGNDYPFFYPYIMPDENVIMTAIWQPIVYVVVFNSGVSSIPNIKIEGQTNSIIIAPYLKNERKGYAFVGWILYNTEVYYPGDEIVIRGQMPGIGISAKAIWNLN